MEFGFKHLQRFAEQKRNAEGWSFGEVDREGKLESTGQETGQPWCISNTESPQPQQYYDIIYNGFYKSSVIWWSLSRSLLCFFVCCADVKRFIRAHPFPGMGELSSLWLNEWGPLSHLFTFESWKLAFQPDPRSFQSPHRNRISLSIHLRVYFPQLSSLSWTPIFYPWYTRMSLTKYSKLIGFPQWKSNQSNRVNTRCKTRHSKVPTI